jgi:predicted SAM-dependent methyltransferase
MHDTEAPHVHIDVLYEVTTLVFPLQLVTCATRSKLNRFGVIYHKHVKLHLTYAEAAKEFGECLMHNLTCDGKLE